MTERAGYTGLLVVLAGLLLTATLFAQAPGSMPVVHEHPLLDPGLLDFIKVFGFGGMIFIVWWYDARKIAKLTRLAERYEELLTRYDKVAQDCRDTAVTCAQVNTRMVDKLDQMIAEAKR